MKISLDSLKRFYLFLAIFYYMGYMNFFNVVFAGGQSEDAFSAAASGNTLKQALGIILLLLGVFLITRSKNINVITAIKHSFWWIVLVGYFIASVSWSYAPAISIRRIIAFLTLLVVAFCLVEFFNPRSLLIFIARAIGIVALLGLMYAIVSPDKAFGGEGGIRANAFLGILYDKNGGARLYAYAILIILGLGLYKTRVQKLFFVIPVFCLIFTQSATAAVMVFFGSILTIIFKAFRSSHSSRNFFRFLVLFIGLIIGCFIVYHLYDFILGVLGRDPTLTNRILIWELLDKYIENERLFGYGFGAFWSSSAVAEFIERWGFIANAHSGYYEALLHGGIVCLILVFVLILKPLIDLIKLYIFSDDGDIPATLLPLIVIQSVVNYVGYVVINHNSFDMFLFAIIYFIAVSQTYKLNGIISNSKNRIDQ